MAKELTKEELRIKELEKQLKGFQDKAKKQKKNGYINVPNDTLVILKSNVEGVFIINEQKGANPLFAKLPEYSYTINMTYKEVSMLVSSRNKFFTKGRIAVVEIISPDDDVSYEDVIKALRLDAIYLDENKVNPAKIEDIFDKKCSTDKFRKLVENTPEMHDTVLEVAGKLFKDGKFNDNEKMNVIRQIYRNIHLFNN